MPCMATSTERARIARERKRNGVAQHACGCGHKHYPCNGVAPIEPESNGVAPPPHATPLQPCPECATRQANLQTAIDRGKAYQQEAIGLRQDLTLMERSYQAARATLIAHGLPDPEE